MEAVVYTCQIISPMFLHGADAKELELLSAAFKSSMRFWWRALQREDGNDLLKRERALFGGGSTEDDKIRDSESSDNRESEGKKKSGKRSPFDISVKWVNELEPQRKAMLLHKTGREQLQRKAFSEGSVFEITLFMRDGKQEKKLSFYESLFELSSLLGGVGQRARRGMGSYHVIRKRYPLESPMREVEIFDKKTLLGEIKKRIQIINNSVECTTGENVLELILPQKYTSEVKLYKISVHNTGIQNSIEVCKKISEATHNIRANKLELSIDGSWKTVTQREFDCCLGGVRPQRQASPVYVSVAKYGNSNSLNVTAAFLTPDYSKLNRLSDPNSKMQYVKQIQNAFFDLIKV